MSEPRGRFAADVTTPGGALSISVNGAEVFATSWDGRSLVEFEEWTLAGNNTLRIRVDPPPPTGTPLRVRVRPARATADDPMKATWGADPAAGPLDVTLPFTLAEPPRARLGTFATVMTADLFTTEERANAAWAALELHAAFEARSVARITEAWSWRLADLQLAYPDDDAEAFLGAAQDVILREPYGIVPVAPKDLELRLLMGGRVVEVGRRGGLPLIEALEDPRRLPASVRAFVAHVDDAWRLVR